MVLGPGTFGARATVVLRPGELLPVHLNVEGVLVFEERNGTWVRIKESSEFLSIERLSFQQMEPAVDKT